MISISIFTPTNNVSFLEELYYSIKNQEYLEWIIFPNGKASVDDIPEVILEDARTIIVASDDPPTSNIGALKRTCCSVAEGSVLCEVDHDDILAPTAIDKIRQAFEDPEVVFAYSDLAAFNDDAHRTPRFYGSANTDNMYDSIYGWRYYNYEQDGFLYKAVITPDSIPAHVSIIHHAPDHIRAFRRSVYEEIGGYDASLSVCDDQDLMCRFYTKGKFKHIKECLYLYRVSGNQNTWLRRNDLIQRTTVELQKKYLHTIAEYWARKHGYKCIDLGGRFNKPEGYLSVDLKDADINCDLNSERWPFEDSSVGIVRASDALEHLRDPINTMKEIHRILIPGGYFFSLTPSVSGAGAWMDPTHTSFWHKNSFWYYSKASSAKYIDTPVRFKELILEEFFPNEWARINNIPYIRADLISLKNGFRPHGLIEI